MNHIERSWWTRSWKSVPHGVRVNRLCSSWYPSRTGRCQRVPRRVQTVRFHTTRSMSLCCVSRFVKGEQRLTNTLHIHACMSPASETPPLVRHVQSIRGQTPGARHGHASFRAPAPAQSHTGRAQGRDAASHVRAVGLTSSSTSPSFPTHILQMACMEVRREKCICCNKMPKQRS